MTVPATCVTLPSVPTIPSIQFIGGAQLKAVLDFSQGTPTDCSLALNLMAQLSGALGSIECLIRVLKVLGKLKAVVGPPPNVGALVDLKEPLEELAECVAATIPGGSIALTIRDILRLVVNFLSCLLQEIESVLQARARIDLSVAVGNPKLEGLLICARDNAETSAKYLVKSLEPVQPLLAIVAGLPGAPGGLPDLGAIAGEADLARAVQQMRDAVAALQAISI